MTVDTGAIPHRYTDIYRYGSGSVAPSTPVTFYSDAPGTTPASLTDQYGLPAANPQSTDLDGELTVYSLVWPLYYKAAGDTETHFATLVA